MKHPFHHLLPFLLTPGAACVMPPADAPARESVALGTAEPNPWARGNERSLLYARDGSPVPNQAAAAITTAEGLGRGLAPEEGSRPYLLELYQQAIEQKEELALEVSALHAALEESDHRLLEAQTENEGMQMRLHELEQRLNALEADKLDLAGRLATAQIRRLEAEKVLLEATLEWNRLQAARVETATGEDGRE